MEEKKFPWILRLLSVNKPCIPILDTFALNKENIIAIFANDANSNIAQIPFKHFGFSKAFECIKHLLKSKLSLQLNSAKHVFFLHKGFRKEITTKKLKDYESKKISIPTVSYIQSSGQSIDKFIIYSVNYDRNGYKSSIIPTNSSVRILDQAKEISKVIISLTELSENKKVIKLQLELLKDKSQKLWLGNVLLCQILQKDKILSFRNLSDVCVKKKSNELLEMMNEFGGHLKVLKRQQSFIKRINRNVFASERIKIESPECEDSLIESWSSDDFLKNSPKNSEIKNNSKNWENWENIGQEKQFLELLCKTIIVHKQPAKKFMISDDEYKIEYRKISKILENANKADVDAKNLLKNAREASNHRKSSSIIITNSQISTNRSKSMMDILTPVLKNRSKLLKKEIKPFV